MYNPQITAERIKKRAKELSIPMTQLNKLCGINKNAIAQAGKSQEGMKAKNLYAIAEVLACSIDYLLGRTDDPKGSADTYVGENNSGIVQAHNGSAVVNTGTSDKRSTEVMEQFLTAFDKLKIEDKVEVMSFAMQKAKGGV